jgi:hypothetical protein
MGRSTRLSPKAKLQAGNRATSPAVPFLRATSHRIEPPLLLLLKIDASKDD